MGFAPEEEQKAMVATHPDLYGMDAGMPARLQVNAGEIQLGSLDYPGFALNVQRTAVAPDLFVT